MTRRLTAAICLGGILAGCGGDGASGDGASVAASAAPLQNAAAKRTLLTPTRPGTFQRQTPGAF